MTGSRLCQRRSALTSGMDRSAEEARRDSESCTRTEQRPPFFALSAVVVQQSILGCLQVHELLEARHVSAAFRPVADGAVLQWMDRSFPSVGYRVDSARAARHLKWEVQKAHAERVGWLTPLEPPAQPAFCFVLSDAAFVRHEMARWNVLDLQDDWQPRQLLLDKLAWSLQDAFSLYDSFGRVLSSSIMLHDGCRQALITGLSALFQRFHHADAYRSWMQQSREERAMYSQERPWQVRARRAAEERWRRSSTGQPLLLFLSRRPDRSTACCRSWSSRP